MKLVNVRLSAEDARLIEELMVAYPTPPAARRGKAAPARDARAARRVIRSRLRRNN